MNNELNLKLPTNCAQMTEQELQDTNGGAAIETAVKAVIAIGGAAVLTGVAAVAAKGILSIFNPKSWSDAAENTSSFLSKLFGGSTL